MASTSELYGKVQEVPQSEKTPFYLPQALIDWDRPIVRVNGEDITFPRRATVSSFGAGGSNAHLIIEEYIPPKAEISRAASATSPQIVVFSAATSERLEVVAQKMLEYIEQNVSISLTNFAYTLQVGREAMAYRLAMVVRDRDELISGLKGYLKHIREIEKSEFIIPVFTSDMEDKLMSNTGPLDENHSLFRQKADEFDAVASEILGLSLVTTIYDPDKVKGDSFDQVRISSLAIIMIEYGGA